MARVTLDAVAKTYRGGVRAVYGVDVEIADGEFIVIVGPSGCGKSTLLRMVAGLETITGGRLLIDGREMNRLEPAERDIAMVFQNYALYPHMSVYDNMAYGLRNRRVPRAEIDSKVLAAADTLGLADLLKRKPRQLSGGQRQRVAMGRAIVREPKVFLFDEPLSNLDAKLRVTMRVEIKRLQRQLGVTALYVTHDQVEAMTLADRLLVMNAGRVEQIGAPSEVYARPATTFVAGFMGNPPMNLLPARSPAAQALVDDRPEDGFIGVRPEHLGLAPGGPVRGHVELAEALGAETILHIRVGDERVVLRGHEAPEEGAEVALAAAPGSVARFDAEGRRL